MVDQTAAPEASATSDLAREADAIPIPAADNLSPDRPGEPAAPVTTDAPIGGDPSPEQVATATANHRPVVGIAINTIADTLLPNWKITSEERGQLTEAISVALAHWIPEAGIPPKYMALVAVAFTGYQIANARRNADGTWTPRKIVTEQRQASSALQA